MDDFFCYFGLMCDRCIFFAGTDDEIKKTESLDYAYLSTILLHGVKTSIFFVKVHFFDKLTSYQSKEFLI